VELALVVLLFVVGPKFMDGDAVACEMRNGNDRVFNALASIALGLATAGLITYFARLHYPNRRRWFHLPFVLLLVFVAIELVGLWAWALGIGLSDTNYCY
jgi:hypothetical protein